VTFGFSRIVMLFIVSQSNLTGGTREMIRLPNLTWGSHNFIRDGRFGYYYLVLALLAFSVAALRSFVRSRSGLSLVALRDGEEYAISRGISLARQRLVDLVLSAAIAGFAGAFYGSYLRAASVEVFSTGFTSLILSAILPGGAGSIYGPVAASLY
jgi:branched-chain amino acid transport system permease protein